MSDRRPETAGTGRCLGQGLPMPGGMGQYSAPPGAPGSKGDRAVTAARRSARALAQPPAASGQVQHAASCRVRAQSLAGRQAQARPSAVAWRLRPLGPAARVHAQRPGGTGRSQCRAGVSSLADKPVKPWPAMARHGPPPARPPSALLARSHTRTPAHSHTRALVHSHTRTLGACVGGVSGAALSTVLDRQRETRKP